MFLSSLFAALTALGQTPVLTGNYDNARTNANLNETILTPASVTPGTFGKLFTLSVDGQVYAQPLYVPQLSIDGKGTHNVVFVATMHNSVYAFDADVPDAPLWQVNLGPSVPSVTYDFSDAFPEVGILSTPTIDASKGILYCVSDQYRNGVYSYTLHAIHLSNGQEAANSPATIAGSVPGNGDESDGINATFEPFQHLQRPGLLLLNGSVFVAFGSHADANPYHGWLFAYDATNVQHQTAIYNATPNGARGAIWQCGRGLAADANGFLYLSTGNGDFDGKINFGDSVLKLDTKLKLSSWFSPDDNSTLDAEDNDLGAGGVILVPGTTRLLTGGKAGTTYLLNTADLGAQKTGNPGAEQVFASASNGIYGMAIWPKGDSSVLYVQEGNAEVSSYTMTNGVFDTQPVSSSLTTGTAYEGFALSANGSQPGSGIIWVTFADMDGIAVGGALAAFDATTLDQLWNSRMYAEDELGNFAKFATPTVVNGKVYVPTFSNQVSVYGLEPRQTGDLPPAMDVLVNGGSYGGGAVAPGEIVSVFGTNYGQVFSDSPDLDDDGSIASNLGGVQLLFDGVPAPLLYTTDGQLGAIAPFSLAPGGTTQVQLSVSGTLSQKLPVAVAASHPGLFTADQSGFGQGSILNQDYAVNSSDTPAAPDSIVMLYGTGGGLTMPDSKDGAIVNTIRMLQADTQVSIGGVKAEVLYAGSAPGLVDGVFQINVRIPKSVASGHSVPVALSIGGVSAQTGVTLAVQ